MAGGRFVAPGRLIVGEESSGPLIVLQEPVSFWGGVNDNTGEIIDGHHPQLGVSLAGCALLMGATRGSSSSSSTFLECIRRGTAPAVLLLTQPDPLLVVAVAAAWEIYGHGPAVVVLTEVPALDGVATLRVDATGAIYAVPDFASKSLTTNI